MPGAGVLPDPNPKKMNKTLLASVVFEIYIRCSFLLSLFNMEYEENNEEMVLVFGTQKIHPTGEFVWNLIADMESILKETASTLHELFMEFGVGVPKTRVMDRLQQALSTHPNLAYFEMKNASSEQGTSPVDASKVVKIEFSPEDSMDFLAILKKSGAKEYPKMIVKLNSKTVAQLRVLKEKLSKKTTKEVRLYSDNIENEDTAFGQLPDESDGALVWNNIPPYQHGEKSPSLLLNRGVLKHVLGHLGGLDFAILWKVSSQVRQNVEAIRPNPKITSFSMELKTHREIKLTVNGTIILYKESRIRSSRRGQVVDRDIRSISIKDLGIILKNQRDIMKEKLI